MFGLNLVSVLVGVVVAQVLPATVGGWIKGKLFPAATAVVTKVEA